MTNPEHYIELFKGELTENVTSDTGFNLTYLDVSATTSTIATEIMCNLKVLYDDEILISCYCRCKLPDIIIKQNRQILIEYVICELYKQLTMHYCQSRHNLNLFRKIKQWLGFKEHEEYLTQIKYESRDFYDELRETFLAMGVGKLKDLNEQE